jgi:hypothetical protein
MIEITGKYTILDMYEQMPMLSAVETTDGTTYLFKSLFIGRGICMDTSESLSSDA